MTATAPSRSEPLLENVVPSDNQADRMQRSRTVRDRSLAAMMSLSDGRRFVLESLGLILVISLAGPLIPGSLAPVAMPPRGLWIPVVLMSCQYGIMGGLFATLAATAAVFLNGLPPQSAAQDFYAYAGMVAAQPCAWFGAALLLGGLRTLHIHHYAELRDQLEHTALMAEDFADGLTRAAGEIERLEHRIATDTGSLAGFLHGFAKIDLRDRESLLASVADVIRYGVGASSFRIYLQSRHVLVPCFGLDDGTRLPAAAISSMPPLLTEDRGGEVADRIANAIASHVRNALVWAPLPSAVEREPIGIVICTRLLPSRDPVRAGQRLVEVCRILAVLLAVCPAPTSDAR